MSTLAIIPARSGSKGLRNKNIANLCGKPLMCYTLEAAVCSGVFSEVMVSTDSEQYADIAKSVEGVSVPFLRNPNTSGDRSSTWDVVKEVLSNYKKFGKEFDMFCILQPTSPMRNAKHIKEAYALYLEKEANSIVSVCPLGHSINICNELPEDGSMVSFIKDPNKYARQMNPSYYRLNGSIYMCKTDAFLAYDTIYKEKSFAYIMSEEDSIDIDTADDLFIAEKLKERELHIAISANIPTKEKPKDVIIFGSGGHAKVIADIVLKSGDNLIGFIDSYCDEKKVDGFPVLGSDEEYVKYPDAEFIIGIGDSSLREKLSTYKCRWYTAIHPTAVVSSLGVSIGEGSVVMANTVINSNATIGKHCIVNTSSIIEHDDVISDFSHISVGAELGGNVFVGNKSWIGIGATVKNGIRICDDVLVGAGAVVIKDIVEQGIYVGLPARKIHEKKLSVMANELEKR